jgi:hypothetical protein
VYEDEVFDNYEDDIKLNKTNQVKTARKEDQTFNNLLVNENEQDIYDNYSNGIEDNYGTMEITKKIID